MYASEKFWDKQAKSFDQGDNESDPDHLKTVNTIKKYLKSSDRVLDFACGTGPMALAMADAVNEVHAIDISSKMLAVGQRKANERGLENIQFTQTTLFDTRFKPGSFDAILAFNILHLLPDMKTAVIRINELLKPGGIFISSSACLGEQKKVFYFFLNVLGKTGLLPKTNAFSAKELKETINNGGFHIEESKLTSETFPNLFITATKIE